MNRKSAKEGNVATGEEDSNTEPKRGGPTKAISRRIWGGKKKETWPKKVEQR